MAVSRADFAKELNVGLSTLGINQNITQTHNTDTDVICITVIHDDRAIQGCHKNVAITCDRQVTRCQIGNIGCACICANQLSCHRNCINCDAVSFDQTNTARAYIGGRHCYDINLNFKCIGIGANTGTSRNSKICRCDVLISIAGIQHTTASCY